VLEPAIVFSMPPHTITAPLMAMPRPTAMATRVPIMRVTEVSARAPRLGHRQPGPATPNAR